MYSAAYRITKRVVVENKLHLLILLAVFLLTQALLFVVPYISKIQIEILEAKLNKSALFDSRTTFFVFILILLFISNSFKNLLLNIKSYISTLAQGRFSISMDKIVFKKLSSLDVGVVSTLRKNRLIYIFFDLSELPFNLFNFSITIFFTICTIFGLVPILIRFNGFKIILIIVISEILRILILKFLVKKQNRFKVLSPSKISKIKEIIFLFKYNLDSILKVGGEKSVFERYVAGKKSDIQIKLDRVSLGAKFDIFLGLIDHGASLMVAIILGISVINGDITIGIFTMSILYVRNIQSSVSLLGSFYRKWYSYKIKIIQLNFFLGLKVENASSEKDKLKIEDIVFSNVSFSYPNPYENEFSYLKKLLDEIKTTKKKGEIDNECGLEKYFEEVMDKKDDSKKKVISGMDIKFRKGKINALVGLNGSGKTTLISLLTRDYMADNGKIKIGQTDISKTKSMLIRENSSRVFEDSMILNSVSLRENLLMGVEKKYRDEEIVDLIEKFDISNQILPPKDILDKLIGNDINFSSGQMQILSIIRAILQDRSIIIIDEGTSRLDAILEKKVLDKLHMIKSSKVIIFITHRMTTAKSADIIHVIDKGVLKDVGTHRELVEDKKSLYHDLWHEQVG